METQCLTMPTRKVMATMGKNTHKRMAGSRRSSGSDIFSQQLRRTKSQTTIVRTRQPNKTPRSVLKIAKEAHKFFLSYEFWLFHDINLCIFLYVNLCSKNHWTVKIPSSSHVLGQPSFKNFVPKEARSFIWSLLVINLAVTDLKNAGYCHNFMTKCYPNFLVFRVIKIYIKHGSQVFTFQFQG